MNNPVVHLPNPHMGKHRMNEARAWGSRELEKKAPRHSDLPIVAAVAPASWGQGCTVIVVRSTELGVTPDSDSVSATHLGV